MRGIFGGKKKCPSSGAARSASRRRHRGSGRGWPRPPADGRRRGWLALAPRAGHRSRQHEHGRRRDHGQELGALVLARLDRFDGAAFLRAVAGGDHRARERHAVRAVVGRGGHLDRRHAGGGAGLWLGARARAAGGSRADPRAALGDARGDPGAAGAAPGDPADAGDLVQSRELRGGALGRALVAVPVDHRAWHPAHCRHHGGARPRAHVGAVVGLGRLRARLPRAVRVAAFDETQYRHLGFGCKLGAMSEAEALFQVLRKSADAGAVNAIEQLVRDGLDRELCRVNALAFAAKVGLGEEPVISAFLHAARIGLFDLSWNVLCPGCGGVLEAGATLKTVDRSEYSCALCPAGYEPTLDEMVEVTFTVSPRVRRIAAHAPHQLPPVEYFRQVFWSSGADLPGDSLEQVIDELTLEQIELPPGERAFLSLQLPAEFVIVFEPVTHAAHFIEVKGEPTRERQTLSMVFNKVRAPNGTTEMRPGPLRLALENRTDLRALPGVWIAGDKLHDLLGRRRPFLPAKRLLTNQT